MICPKCGKLLGDNYKFCNKCGYKIVPVREETDLINLQVSESELVEPAGHAPTDKKKLRLIAFSLSGVLLVAALVMVLIKMDVFNHSGENVELSSLSEEDKEDQESSDEDDTSHFADVTEKTVDDKGDDYELKDDSGDAISEFNDTDPFPLAIQNYEYDEAKSWKEAYLRYLREEAYIGYDCGETIYVNDDDIPELVLYYLTPMDSLSFCLLTCDGKRVSSILTERYSFSYIEGKGMIANSGGRMGYYYDNVFTIKDGEWTGVFAGEYSDFSTDGSPVYRINGVEVTENEYNDGLSSVFDRTGAIASSSVCNNNTCIGEVRENILDEFDYIDYIFPDSSINELTWEDLTGLSANECRIARNEIYARHGRQFDDTGLQEYFSNRSWYEGTTSPSEFAEEKVLNDIEKSNRNLIVEYEERRGYR